MWDIATIKVAVASVHQWEPIDMYLAEQVLDPKQRVSFLDTSALPSACEQLSNPGEADIIMLIVQSLQGMGLPTGSIGVISPYRSQVSGVPPFTALSPLHI